MLLTGKKRAMMGERGRGEDVAYEGELSRSGGQFRPKKNKPGML